MGKRKKKKRSKVDPQDIQAIAMESTMLPTHEIVTSPSKKKGKMSKLVEAKLRKTPGSEKGYTKFMQSLIPGGAEGGAEIATSAIGSLITGGAAISAGGERVAEGSGEITTSAIGSLMLGGASLPLSKSKIKTHTESHPLRSVEPPAISAGGEQVAAIKPLHERVEQSGISKPVSKKEKRKHKRSIKKSKREESKEISKYKLKGNV